MSTTIGWTDPVVVQQINGETVMWAQSRDDETHYKPVVSAEPDTDPLADDSDTEFKDARLAYRFRDAFVGMGHPVLFTEGLGWLVWSKGRWRPTDAGTIRGKIMDFALDWMRDLVGDGVGGASQEYLGNISALLNDARAGRVVKAMEALIREEAAAFDRHPNLLNCRNGVVDLESGVLLPHDPDLLLTKITNVAYKPEATHRDWEKAKAALAPEVRDYYLDRLGQAITGHTPTDDKIVFSIGPGGNGKSTLLEPVRRALGTYAGMVPQKLLLANPNDHSTEFMALRGLRLALCEELPEAARMNTQRLKTIAGTEAITARNVYRDNVTFEPTHALFVNTNHAPTVVETDHGTWRRLEKVPFDRKFRDEDGSIDTTLRQRVKRPAVAEAALADLVRHATRWYKNGRTMPKPPAEVAEATQEWRGESDDLLAFFNERLEFDPQGGCIALSVLLAEFNTWLDQKGGSRTHWGDRLLNSRLSTNESLPVRFDKHKTRKHRMPGGRVETEGNPVWAWRGVTWAK